jgi:flavin-dependent dehydrogenase
MREKINIAIVGAGPAGCTLASLLALRGMRVLVFDDEMRPKLLVGESLLPTVVPILRRLGVEQRVRAISTLKPGVGFLAREGSRIDFFFPEKAHSDFPNYAYNVPRPGFDEILRERAEELGVVFVKRRAIVSTGDPSHGREILLSKETLDSTPELGGEHPDLLADATGRARLFSKLLQIPSEKGERNDAAYFAHYEDFDLPAAKDGQVVITTLNRGWSWRIPLPGRLSVGVVIDKHAARAHGSTAEERLESIIASEPMLRDDGKRRRRISEVMVYTNYQLISERGHGPGWVALGDAFGFVDPMLSPGLFMAMLSADLLDKHLFSAGNNIMEKTRRMDQAFAELRDWHQSWREIIRYFYDGRMHSLYESGSKLSETYGKFALPVMVEKHLTRQITGMVSGARTRSRYGRKLLELSSRHLVWGVKPPSDYAVMAGTPD